MFIDPDLEQYVAESRQLNELVAAFMPSVPSFATAEGLAELRANSGFFAAGEVDGVEERSLPGPVGPIPARVIVPPAVAAGDQPAAVYLDLHGGGWCIGDARSGDVHNDALARAANVVTVSIDYRLAPEHPFPAGPDDCEAAANWLLEQAEHEWGTARLFIGGGSAGAHLAALTLLRVRDRHGAAAVQRFAGANLVFGAFDLGLTPSQRAGRDALVIPLDTIEACCANFLPGRDREARRDPAYSPLFADLRGLPPALFTVGTLDPLLDDSLFMYERWTAAGNRAELAVYPESVHGFVSFPTEMARVARERMIAWVCACLDSSVG